MAFSSATIQLFLNTAGAKDALSGFQRQFDSTIANIGKVALGLLGVRGLGGIYNQMQQIVQVSERWQLPVEKVSQFANAFSLFGGNAEGAVQTIEKFQQLANNLKFHSSGALRDLSAIIGVNLNNKDYLGVVNAIRTQYNKLNKDAQVEVLDMLGMDDLAMQRMLKASDAEFRAAMTEASEMGVVTDDLAKSLRDIERGWARLKASLVAAFAPMLESLKPVLNALNRLLTWFNRLDPKTKQWVATILTAAVAIKSLGAALKLLNLGGILGLATNPLAWIVGAAAAALLLATNWDKVVEKFEEWKTKYPDYAGDIDGLRIALEGLGGAFKKVFGWVKDFGEWIGTTYLGAQAHFARERVKKGLKTGEIDQRDLAILETHAGILKDNGSYENLYNETKDLLEKGKKAKNERLHTIAFNSAVTEYMPRAESVRAVEAYRTWPSPDTAKKDNVINIGTMYITGVDGAEDMMSRIENLPRNNMLATKSYPK